jgi:hypothetical protein
METVDIGLGRPDTSVGESDAASIPDTRRWLTHELCKARARRPSSRSWPLAHRARRLRVETAMSVAGTTRRCCTSSSRSTGRPSSSEPSSPAACLISSSRSSRRTYAAAVGVLAAVAAALCDGLRPQAVCRRARRVHHFSVSLASSPSEITARPALECRCQCPSRRRRRPACTRSTRG